MADPVEQQVTSKTPATKQKNPKRVAAGKAIAKKMKQAREAQKKALAEAQIIIANNQLKPDAPSADLPPDAPSEPTKITTTQWLSVISIIVSLAGLYYKREEIKGIFTKKPPVIAALPSPVFTLEKEGVKMYYAPSSLYWDLKNRSETNFIKYEGTQTSARGYEYPVFKFTK